MNQLYEIKYKESKNARRVFKAERFAVNDETAEGVIQHFRKNMLENESLDIVIISIKKTSIEEVEKN